MNFSPQITDALVSLGWDDYFNQHLLAFINKHGPLDPSSFVARVCNEEKIAYRLIFSNDPNSTSYIWAEIRGRFRHHHRSRADYPTVGDWVLAYRTPHNERAIIQHVLPRKTFLLRKSAGSAEQEQALAANIDYGFIVNSLNADLSLRRIERYLSLVWEGGARPVILLSKADLSPNLSAQIAEVRAIAGTAPVHAISTLTQLGLDELKPYLGRAQTSVVLGSSGVGKSTLVNWLLKSDTLKVQDVREQDDKGRHTTTARHLFILESGAIVIDTPGMRELQLWNATEGVGSAFDDVTALTLQCRFTNCQHLSEPGCALQKALASGVLARERFESWNKLKKETQFQNKSLKPRAKLKK